MFESHDVHLFLPTADSHHIERTAIKPDMSKWSTTFLLELMTIFSHLFICAYPKSPVITLRVQHGLQIQYKWSSLPLHSFIVTPLLFYGSFFSFLILSVLHMLPLCIVAIIVVLSSEILCTKNSFIFNYQLIYWAYINHHSSWIKKKT